MRSFVQVLTTPTSDTPGTTLILHFDNKRYLIGSLAEGTQRACVQMGARLLKVNDVLITGQSTWRNMGGLIGMILTLADAAGSSKSAATEEAAKRARTKAKRDGMKDEEEVWRVGEEAREEAEREADKGLRVLAPPNANQMLATARRFVFRKGMPVDVHEVGEGGDAAVEGKEGEPYWVDENVKVWAFTVSPEEAAGTAARSAEPAEIKMKGTVSPRKRSIHEANGHPTMPVASKGALATATDTDLIATDLSPAHRATLTSKAIVAEMFNSTWRLDTLHETPLSQVNLPATVFLRHPDTRKIEKYTGPIPNADNPHMTVLVRKPWPGALVETLPEVQVRKESVCYVIRNHTQRGKFRPQEATRLGVEKGVKWAKLSKGETVLNERGEEVRPEQVLGESKEGGGIAVIDVPGPEFIDAVIGRKEWGDARIMTGVGAVVWICGKGVVGDERVRRFMTETLAGLEHVLSAPDVCVDSIALDSAAAATARLRQVDGKRYSIPWHQDPAEVTGAVAALPKNARPANRGMMIQLEPKLELQTKQIPPPLDLAATEAATSQDVLALAAEARKEMETSATSPETLAWLATLPPGAGDVEITTLGTGSALPSKYRNVSATLLRCPGWGNLLLDAGENTLGQLKRVFPPDELAQVLRDLKLIWISHMHADHHLGTISVIRAWYKVVHNSVPHSTPSKATWNPTTGLAVVSEPAMLTHLSEYAAIEDYGFSRLAPLYITPAYPHKSKPSRLGWFTPPSFLAGLGSQEARKEYTESQLVPPCDLNLTDIQAVPVQHCHGARAVSVTLPSGFKVSYSGDCRPSKSFEKIGRDSTLVIHEATFDDELVGDAVAKNHSTTSEALGVAQGMRAWGCVLTHFSQRYQKVPVLEREDGNGATVGWEDSGEEAEAEALVDHEAETDGPLEHMAAATTETLPDQHGAVGEGERVALPPRKGHDEGLVRGHGAPGKPEAMKFRLKSDMRVAVAFDYMRVKVGELGEVEKFTPALLRLFEEEEVGEKEVAAAAAAAAGDAKAGKKGKGGQREDRNR